MQLYALDETGQWIEARNAQKQRDYCCIECRGVVRLRSGDRRHPHYYHLERPAQCRQHGKSEAHLRMQLHLQKLLPAGDCRLEMRFDGIGRIADTAWLSQKLVFEIQCSPITATEVRERNAAYAKAGYQVVWILHDRRFNRWKLSGAEQAMRHRPHYFTDMDSRGVGRVYDQWATLLRGRRISRGQKHVVDLSQPRRLNAPSFRGWTLSFAGDLQDRYAIGLSELETFSGYLHRAWGFLINMYRALFQFCLEKACR